MPQKQRADTVMTSIRLPRRVHAKLRKVAEATRRPASDIITDAIVAALSVCPSCGRDHEREIKLTGRTTSRTVRA